MYSVSNFIASGSLLLLSSAKVNDAEIIAAVTVAHVAMTILEASIAEKIYV